MSSPLHVTVPASPSWRGAMMNLSGRGPSRAHRRGDSDDESPNRDMGSLLRPPLWGRQPPPQQQQQQTQHLLLNHKSFLTMALVKLEGLMPAYCQALVDPSHANASKACAFLDSSVATASPSNSPQPSLHAPQRAGSFRQHGPSFSAAHAASSTTSTPSGRMSAVPASPRSSKLLQWLAASTSSTTPTTSQSPYLPGGTGMPPISSSAMALEGEWQTYAAPFELLAGAEVLYADMMVQESGKQQQSVAAGTSVALQGLYQRIVQDLVRVEENLCTVFLDMEAISASSSAFGEKALSLSLSLRALTTLCTLRCQFLELSSRLFVEPPSSSSVTEQHQLPPLLLGDVADVVSALLATTIASSAAATSATAHTPVGDLHKDENEPPNGVKVETMTLETCSAHVLIEALIRELQAWKYALEAMSALERCQFLETMIGLRKWQRFLPKTKDTRLSIWFHSSFQDVVCLLPVYMDRVRAFSGPLHGFDTTPMFQDVKLRYDWDGAVATFLKRQEKAGGPPTAVSIVLDAQSTSNLHVERGFWLAANTPEEKSPEEYGARVLWPAVYLRSTIHLAAAAASSGFGNGLLRASVLTSKTSLLPSWSSAEMSKSGSRNSELGQAALTRNHWNVMEYGPDEGKAVHSWPHSEWDALMALLDNKSSQQVDSDTSDLTTSRFDTRDVSQSRLAEEPVAVTYTDNMDEDDDAKTSSDSILALDEHAGSLFSTSFETPSSQTPPQGFNREKQHLSQQTSTFHVVSLSAFLSMVVIVKGEEESRWHRRRSRLGDEEIRSFLDDMASKLRVAKQFAPSRLPTVKTGDARAPRLKPLTEDMIGWTDEDVKSLLKQLKGTFGLRPVNPLQESLRVSSILSRSTISPGSTPGRSRRRRNWRSKPEMPESAAALFLGADLAPLFGDD